VLGGGGPGPGTISYEASVAECIDPTLPDPAYCEQYTGADMLSVDLQETETGNPSNSYLRFDLDGVLDGHNVTDVKLRLVVTNRRSPWSRRAASSTWGCTRRSRTG
jgi:hypothetical protein